MLNITSKKDGSKDVVALEGRLDTTSAHDFKDKLMPILDTATELVLDFKDLEYISSAGLRVLVEAITKMDDKGSMKVINVNENVMDVLDMTGLTDEISIE